jgi:hypothetical protein
MKNLSGTAGCVGLPGPTLFLFLSSRAVCTCYICSAAGAPTRLCHHFISLLDAQSVQDG